MDGVKDPSTTSTQSTRSTPSTICAACRLLAHSPFSPTRLVVSPSPSRFPGRCFLFRGRLWRGRCFNNRGIQEFAGAVNHRREIEFAIRISEIYRARADNLQPGIRKPFC